MGEKLGMKNEEAETKMALGITENHLYTLMPLGDFKEVFGIDDRDDKLARFCLVTSTHSIEQYCKRRLVRKRHIETAEFLDDWFLLLREYPVCKFHALLPVTGNKNNVEWINPECYQIIPDCGTYNDVPYMVGLTPAVKRLNCKAFKAVYVAGYSVEKTPATLVLACMELAIWNFNRYKGRRVGMTGNIKGAGKEGEHFEMSMPENVKQLLEPYKRKLI
jgi:hypothetical protein